MRADVVLGSNLLHEAPTTHVQEDKDGPYAYLLRVSCELLKTVKFTPYEERITVSPHFTHPLTVSGFPEPGFVLEDSSRDTAITVSSSLFLSLAKPRSRTPEIPGRA